MQMGCLFPASHDGRTGFRQPALQEPGAADDDNVALVNQGIFLFALFNLPGIVQELLLASIQLNFFLFRKFYHERRKTMQLLLVMLALAGFLLELVLVLVLVQVAFESVGLLWAVLQ